MVVYFDQVEVPVPLKREHAKAADATLSVTFQGCQTDGICYPPMTRRVTLSIPAGTVTPASTPDVPAPAAVVPLPTTTTTADAAPTASPLSLIHI